VDAQWEEVVEAPFTPEERELTLASFDHYVEVELPAVGSLRARYCAQGMDAGHQQDTVLDDERAPDRYLLQLWPADPAPDAVVRQTSANAAYWHREAQALPPPPTAAERAAAEQATAERACLEAQRAADARERHLWGGRLPSPALRGLGGNVVGVARTERDLLDAFEALDAGTQRAAARWLARRAFQIAGLDQLDWVRPALDAMDRGEPLPHPFTETAAVFPLVRPAPSGGSMALFAAAGPAEQALPLRRIHRPSFAVPAIFSAVDPDPLRALVDAFSHTAATFNEQRDALVAELRQRFID
jgi:hypothetical protein